MLAGRSTHLLLEYKVGQPQISNTFCPHFRLTLQVYAALTLLVVNEAIGFVITYAIGQRVYSKVTVVIGKPN